jgi:hypothetical protein
MATVEYEPEMCWRGERGKLDIKGIPSVSSWKKSDVVVEFGRVLDPTEFKLIGRGRSARIKGNCDHGKSDPNDESGRPHLQADTLLSKAQFALICECYVPRGKPKVWSLVTSVYQSRINPIALFPKMRPAPEIPTGAHESRVSVPCCFQALKLFLPWGIYFHGRRSGPEGRRSHGDE